MMQIAGFLSLRALRPWVAYQLANAKLGDLAYEYDIAGRRTSIAGSFARTGLPQPLTSAAYNANNQITQWGSASFTYDANGNLTNDGAQTYNWNARHQLASLSGSVTA